LPRQPRFGVGDKVQIAGETDQGTVIQAGQITGSTFYYLVLVTGDEDGAYFPEQDLTLVRSAGGSPATWLLEQQLAPAGPFAEFFTIRKLRTRLSDHLYSYLASRTVFRIYQFKPVLKMLTSPSQRLLIADEVGLGKTIEAGLIWNELDARTSLDRVLVVCPAGLRTKWQRELERRFDRDVQIISNVAALADLLKRFERQGSASRFSAIAGLETLRTASALEHLRRTSPSFDLVVVDEAHHMRNRGTNSHMLGEFLSESAEAMIFLTATPLNLGTSDLFNLLNLLSPEDFDSDAIFDQLLEPNEHINRALRELRSTFPPDRKKVIETLRRVEQTAVAERFRRNPLYKHALDRLAEAPKDLRQVVEIQRDIEELNTIGRVFTRTRKRDLSEPFPVRHPATLEVGWTEEEWNVYQAATRYVANRSRRLLEQKVPLGFIAIMPQRQAASCLPVMSDYLQEALQRHQVETDFEEGEEEWSSDSGPKLVAPEMAALEDALQACRALGDVDSKFARLSLELEQIFTDEPEAQMLMFSFFRRTLSYLEMRLRDLGYTVARMDGRTPRDERERLIEEFRESSFQILLSSEIGAEGLDFEFVRYLVNYDLPWNPMRLEQRIGRLDRFGQLHDSIVIVNFSIPGTIETDIFERLYERIGIFTASIGELEPILGEAMRELEKRITDPMLSPAERAQQAEQIALGVVSKRVQLEEFESTRSRLIGNDDYVVEQLDELEQQRRYITPEELERLFRGFLEREVGGRNQLLEDSATPGLYHATMSGRFMDLLRPHLLTMGVSAVGLLTSLDAGSGLTITFSPEVAYQRRAEFINIRHPILRAIVAHYGSGEGRMPRAGALQLPADRDSEFWFFVFLLEASGLVPQHRLLAVAVDASTLTVDESTSALVLSGLASPTLSTPDPIPIPDPAIVDASYELARTHAFSDRDRIHHDLSRTSTAMAVERVESLRQSMTLRIERLTQIVGESRNDRIRKMRESQIRNIRLKTEAKVADIEQRQQVSVSVKPIAGGFLRTTSS
jgi:superfamily II DNA or RNA helicase